MYLVFILCWCLGSQACSTIIALHAISLQNWMWSTFYMYTSIYFICYSMHSYRSSIQCFPKGRYISPQNEWMCPCLYHSKLFHLFILYKDSSFDSSIIQFLNSLFPLLFNSLVNTFFNSSILSFLSSYTYIPWSLFF